MSHPQQQRFVELCAKYFFKTGQSVLEIGSYDVNGSIRKYFDTQDYTGIDLVAGPGVNVVCPGHLYKPTRQFDVVLSCECFEHNPAWKYTFENMAYFLPSIPGLVIFTCASAGRLEHGTPRTDSKDSPGTGTNSYYRNLARKDFSFLPFEILFTEHIFFYEPSSRDLYFVGIIGNSFEKKDEFLKELLEIGNLRLAEPFGLRKIARRIYHFPVWMAMHLLSDGRFQNFQLFYYKATKSLKKLWP